MDKFFKNFLNLSLKGFITIVLMVVFLNLFTSNSINASDNQVISNPSVVVNAGQLSKVHKPGKTHNVRKKDGSIDGRENDLEELARDWLFYRNKIMQHARYGETKKASKARESFQQTNMWLNAYDNADVSFMVDLIENKKAN